MGAADFVLGEGRGAPVGVAGGRLGSAVERTHAGPEDSGGGGRLAQRRVSGASEITRELFRYWFEEEHYAAGLQGPLRFHFGQREAIETLAWLVEVFVERDAEPLIHDHWTRIGSEVVPVPPKIETGMDGRRMVRWRLPRIGDQTQGLPPERLRRYAFRMATGSGKTWVMAMAVVWAHLHRRLVPGSPLSANFLIVAPNVIVFERLRKDFEGNRIFGELPLIPPQWKTEFDQRVILRGEPTEPEQSGNLFLTNVQQLYDRSRHWEPKNPVDAMLGDDSRIGSSQQPGRSILERVASLPDLIVMNDEAHHVHDQDLAWSQSLLDLHRGLPDGLAAWLDFSATPKDQGGLFFPWDGLRLSAPAGSRRPDRQGPGHRDPRRRRR